MINLYKELLRTGDLFEMFDGMTGDFEQDKNSFIEQQTALETFSNNLDVDDEEYIN
jgi:uncharacterized protein YkvS